MCKNHGYCDIKIPEVCDKIFKFPDNHKSMKIPFLIYADTELCLKKHSFVIKIFKKCPHQKQTNIQRVLFHYSHTVYLITTKANMISTDSMKHFCADLKMHATEINNFEKKEMLPLTEKQEKKCKKQKFCHNKNSMKSLMKIKSTVRSGSLSLHWRIVWSCL